jgi:hypothetical protein
LKKLKIKYNYNKLIIIIINVKKIINYYKNKKEIKELKKKSYKN